MTNQVSFGIWRPLMTLVLSSLVIMGSPGPSTISATAVGAAFGFRRSLKYACGLILGTVAVLFAVAIGVVAILLSMPQSARVLAAVSAVYILFLAFKIATAPPLESRSQHAAAPAFAGGFLLAIANPKAYLAIAAVFAGTTIFVEDRGIDAMAKTALLSVMIVTIHVSWLGAGALLSPILHDPIRSRIVNVLLAASLVVMTFMALIS
jgi:threonine/homoserine/homoserine lactone efflux protein